MCTLLVNSIADYGRLAPPLWCVDSCHDVQGGASMPVTVVLIKPGAAAGCLWSFDRGRVVAEKGRGSGEVGCGMQRAEGEPSQRDAGLTRDNRVVAGKGHWNTGCVVVMMSRGAVRLAAPLAGCCRPPMSSGGVAAGTAGSAGVPGFADHFRRSSLRSVLRWCLRLRATAGSVRASSLRYGWPTVRNAGCARTVSAEHAAGTAAETPQLNYWKNETSQQHCLQMSADRQESARRYFVAEIPAR